MIIRITFEQQGVTHSYYVLKRPGVDELLQHLGTTGLYEIVLFTAASKEYVDVVVEA
jgi:TFIIF-interacting CTD phosphatase-like protein